MGFGIATLGLFSSFVAGHLSSGLRKTYSMSSTSDNTNFVNASRDGEIPSFNGDAKAKATDFANYFCSYAQLYHQKQMLADHQRMAAYHSAILGNQDVFRDKVVMDIGTGSGILAVWAAQAGARKVYAIEYTDMAKHAEKVMEANGVSDIVQVVQGAVEEVELPVEKDNLTLEQGDDEAGSNRVVDIIISEWMGYFLLRESMLDSIVRARDKFLKKKTGLMFPSHTTMLWAPVTDEEERRQSANDYAGSMSDWTDFAQTTHTVYGVDMSVLENDFEREQKEYYLLSSRWSELPGDAVLAEPKVVRHFDMATCTIEESRGIPVGYPDATFDFDVNGDEFAGPISGFAGWFTADFKSRTDAEGLLHAPKIHHPAFLSTGPENGYTHWGQQFFMLPFHGIPCLKGQTTRLEGTLEMTRTKENSRLYNCRVTFTSSRRRSDEPKDGEKLMQSGTVTHVYQIP